MYKIIGKKILISALCIGLAGGMISGTAFADEIPLAGVAAHIENKDNAVPAAPVEAAETLAQTALALSEGTAVLGKVEEIEAEVTTEEVTEEATEVATTEEVTETETEAVIEETGEHPAILAVEARINARKNSVYNGIAVSQVSSAVNIRTEPNSDSEIVGKIYNNCAATILKTINGDDGKWYKIQSGSVEGYIKAKYFVTGEDVKQLAMELGCVNAQITTSTMRMRESADLGSATVTVLTKGHYYTVEEQGDEFSKLSIDGELQGYVQNDYLKFDIAFKEAVSIEEEMAREAEEERLQREAEEARERYLRELEEEEEEYTEAETEPETTAEKTTEAETEPETREETTEAVTEETEAETAESETEEETTEAETEKETKEETTEAETTQKQTEASTEKASSKKSKKDKSSLREAIVAEAWSYVGKLDYVWAGNSLVTGVDCSGFTQQIFKKYGISLPRTSTQQGRFGEAVSRSEARPGDIVHYEGHVAIYVGDGLIVHAANARSGVISSVWNYRSPESIRNVIGD